MYNDNDNIWLASTGPLRETDILMGETFDARLENTGWDKAGFDDSNWNPVKWRGNPHGVVEAYPGVPVQIQEELKAVTR
jgi:alpha-L-rhamnosidase